MVVSLVSAPVYADSLVFFPDFYLDLHTNLGYRIQLLPQVEEWNGWWGSVFFSLKRYDLSKWEITLLSWTWRVSGQVNLRICLLLVCPYTAGAVYKEIKQWSRTLIGHKEIKLHKTTRNLGLSLNPQFHIMCMCADRTKQTLPNTIWCYQTLQNTTLQYSSAQRNVKLKC